MRPRYLKVVVRLSGFEMPIAVFKLQKFVDMLEADTDLVCPKCKQKPMWKGGYVCNCCPQCGKLMEKAVVDERTVNWKCAEHGWQEPSHYNHWSQLLQFGAVRLDVFRLLLVVLAWYCSDVCCPIVAVALDGNN